MISHNFSTLKLTNGLYILYTVQSSKEGRSYQGLEAAPGAALRLARKRKSLEGGGKPKKASGGNKKGKKSKKPRTA